MNSLDAEVRVILAPDGFYPQALQFAGASLRVLSVEAFWTTGVLRRFRVRTPAGPYGLELHLGTGAWGIWRRPGWLARARARLAAQPRYPLPARRRRARLPSAARPVQAVAAAAGGSHASRLTLVRQ